MKTYRFLIIAALALFSGLFAVFNLLYDGSPEPGRPYVVEAERLCLLIGQGGEPSLEGCEYVTAATRDDGSGDIFSYSGECLFRQVNGTVWRFDYKAKSGGSGGRLMINLALGAGALLTLLVLLYIRRQIIKPFNEMSEVPYQLSRGNLAAPLKESRSRYFGRYIWGTDMLRESIEAQRERELELQKDKQILLLSISHDIKTPLAAIKLYANALSRGLYKNEDKLKEVYEGIGIKAREIENYTAELMRSAGGDFLALEVKEGEIYLSDLIGRIREHYADRLARLHTEFEIGKFGNCLISCDPDRAAEVLQNLMENAVKYGDGRRISITVDEEEDCKLITVSNTGCTLPDEETPHIFDSFWRGSNSSGKPGSGLGLYICRQLMSKMNGDIFARCENGIMNITAVFRMA
ncbi:Signal transduction histidine kinase [Ruminococcaceae bacterium FB2012]|nr:Signal transduction histidine kinase [Ruminococcaceae bacterium FB2012]